MAFLISGAPAGAGGPPPGRGLSIRDTRHNLSRSGRKIGNTVVAEGTDRICVFCHTPHVADPKAPLWNRESPGATYKLYASSTMRGVPRQPEGRSRQCLSCHDGTVAVGAVRRRPRGLPPHAMTRMAGVPGFRLVGRATSLGADLSDDHPIVVDYDEASAENDEFAPRASLPREFGLSGLKGNSTVHCTTCHDAHRNEHHPFLVMDNTASRMCATCHLVNGWRDAVHRTSTTRWNGEGDNPFHLPGDGSGSGETLTVAENACESCHKPHGAAKAERLLKGDEEAACFTCHNGNCAEADVEPEFVRPYGHRVAAYNGVHDAYENVDPLGQALDAGENDNRMRHVECFDCHNSHATGGEVHAAGTNEASGILRGVSGVRLTYGASPWEPAGFSWVPASPGVSYEYEICMKCHSSWIWESLPPLTADGSEQTDASVEFSPGNASYHAVVGESRASVFGDYEPPWNSRSRMYCTDCHGGDGPSDSAGAHGSRVGFLLRGSYDRTTGSAGTEGHLCFLCHRFSTYADPSSVTSFRNTGFASQDRRNLHALHAGKTRKDVPRTVVCRDCHAGRPHGIGSRKALIVVRDPTDEQGRAPYRDDRPGDEAGIDTVTFPLAPQAWENVMGVGGNCTTVGCH